MLGTLLKKRWDRRFLLFFLLGWASPVAIYSPARAAAEASVFRVALPDPVIVTPQDVAHGAPVVVRLLGLSAPWQTEVVERILGRIAPPAQVILVGVHFEKWRPVSSGAVWTVKGSSTDPAATRKRIVDSFSFTFSPEGKFSREYACPSDRQECAHFVKSLTIEKLLDREVRLSFGTFNDAARLPGERARVNAYRPVMNYGFE